MYRQRAADIYNIAAMTLTSLPANQRVRSRRTRFVVAGVFLLFLLVFAATTQRGPAWQDSGIFQLRILRTDFSGWLGVALAHPVLIALGKLAGLVPVGPITWRINMVSAVLGAVSCASIAALVLRLWPGRWFISIAAAGWFGLGHATWWLATICESQIILATIFTLELHVVLTLLRSPRARWAAVLGVLNGVGLATHNLALLALPVYGLMVLALAGRGWMPWRGVACFIGSWLIGASPWLVLVGMEIPDLGLAGAVNSGLFGRGWQDSVLVGSGRALVMGPIYVLLQFPNLALPLAAVGLVTLRRLRPAALKVVWGALLAIYLLFALRYDVPDQFMFFLPAHAMLTLWASAGVAHLTGGNRRRWIPTAAVISVLWTPLVYLLAPTAWDAIGRPAPGRTDLAYRDPVRYWLWPWKGQENSAGRFALETLENLPAGSTIIADTTAAGPLKIVKETGRAGADIRVLWTSEVSQRGQGVSIGRKNLYVVNPAKGYCPEWIRSAARFERAEGAPVYRVIRREEDARE